MKDLFTSCSIIPDKPGVYLVIYEYPKTPDFVIPGTGGKFKDKDPNVTGSVLLSKWVKETVVIYIGQAGGNGSGATLKKRIHQYVRFGQGVPVGHWGGRYIWQLKNSNNLLVCWKPVLTQDPRNFEAKLIQDFLVQYGKMPFANLVN